MTAPLSIWHAAQSGKDIEARNALMNEHLRLVKHVARQVMRSTPAEVEFDELVSAGSMGLAQAIDKFDPSRGLAFSTFAAPRIRGAVLDDLRRRDSMSRSVRKKQRELAATRERLSAALGRRPTDAEMAGELGIGVHDLWGWERTVEAAAPVSIDKRVSAHDHQGTTVAEIVAAEDGTDIDASINHREEMDILRVEITSLKEQERVVLALYYFEELKLREIAEVLGVTESRVSQIRSRAIARLGEKMAYLRAA